MSARTIDQLETDIFLAQAEDLAVLMAHPAWAAYSKLLAEMRQDALEKLAACNEPAEFRFHQGVAKAIGTLVDLPARITAAAAEILSDEESEKSVVRTELRNVIGAGLDHDGEF